MLFKEKIKRIIRTMLCVTISISYVANATAYSVPSVVVMRAIEGSCGDNICFYTNALNISASKANILSKTEKFEKEIIDINDGIMSMFKEIYTVVENYSIDEEVHSVEQPTYSASNVEMKVSTCILNNILVSEDTINIDVTNVECNGAVLYSKNGDININGKIANANAILYAPNGKVSISMDNISYDGVIIADEIEINAKKLMVGNTEPNNLQRLLNVKTINITNFGMYYEETANQIIVEYEDEYQSLDLYYRYDDNDFICIEDFDINTYLELPQDGGYLDGYLVVYDKLGNKLITDMYSVYNDAGNYCGVDRDSDDDGIGDGYEIMVLNTNPYSEDSDNDGLVDSKDIYLGNREVYNIKIELEAEAYNTIIAEAGDIFYVDEMQSSTQNKTCYLKKSLLDVISSGYVNDELVIMVYDRITGKQVLEYSDNGYKLYVYNENNNKTAVIAKDKETSIINFYKYNESGDVKSIYHNGFWYEVEYSGNNITKISVAGEELISYTYDECGNIVNVKYANGDESYNTYDDIGSILTTSNEDGIMYEWQYGEHYILTDYIDYVNNVSEHYTYDADGLIARITDTNGRYIQFDYDNDETRMVVGTGNAQKISWLTQSEGSTLCRYSNLLSKEVFFDESKSVFSYDGEEILVIEEDERSNSIVKKIGDMEYKSVFDEVGNLIEEYVNGELVNVYEYDSLGQLIKLDSKLLDVDILYEYDGGGNITSQIYGEKKIYYSYDSEWKDMLVEYNGDSIAYDGAGNPTSYINGITFEWENGRNLKSITSEYGNVSYSYDSNGIRKSKYIDDEKIEYFTNGSKILYEKHEDYDIYYFYNEMDKVQGFEYDGDTYFYITNSVSDIVGIVDTEGTMVVNYYYDAWGNIIDVSGNEALARINPFRYKAYYYDEESGLYYLNSRYYDPTTGRFINADKHIDTNVGIHANNMFAYCENSPIISANSGGEASSTSIVTYDEPKYNYLVGWSPISMSKYNCYAYVMNVTTCEINPSYLCDDLEYYLNLEYLAYCIQEDLEVRGYSTIKVIEESEIASTTGSIIALRVDYTADNGNENNKDYHVMRYVRNANVWFHKPGKTAVLRYKKGISSGAWVSEYYDGEWKSNNYISYTGEIKFIMYK